jgi:hypothetical protein
LPDLAKVYPGGKVSETKIKRTNINLNTELVDAAAAPEQTSRAGRPARPTTYT